MTKLKTPFAVRIALLLAVLAVAGLTTQLSVFATTGSGVQPTYILED